MITGKSVDECVEKANEFIASRAASVEEMKKVGNSYVCTVHILRPQEAIPVSLGVVSAPLPTPQQVSAQEAPVADTQKDTPTEETLSTAGMAESIHRAINALTLRGDFDNLTGQDICEGLWLTVGDWWGEARDYRVIHALDAVAHNAEVNFGPTIKEGLLALRDQLIHSGDMVAPNPQDIPEGTFKQVSRSMPSTGGYPV